MADSVDRVFVNALNTVKKIPRTGSARPPPEARLKLYGLYKQSMEGNVEGVMRRPDGEGVEEQGERQKWDAWSAQHGLSRTEAKRQYITTLIETMHKYASSTSEARDLVAELEFVWDQIKSNSVSSSSSSPGQNLGLSGSLPHQSTYTSTARGGNLMREGTDGNGLRVLRPISDGDEDEDNHNDEEDEEEEEDDFEEARDIRYPAENIADLTVPQSGGNDSTTHRGYEIRNRKWRKRIESALVKMTAEVAALREQIEAKRLFDTQGYGQRRIGSQMLWLFWAVVRHILIDGAILGALVIWVKRRANRDGKGKIEKAVTLVAEIVEEWIWRMRAGLLKSYAVGRQGS